MEQIHTDIERLALEWVKNQHIYKNKFENRPVKCVHSKQYNTISFYFYDPLPEKNLKKSENIYQFYAENTTFENEKWYKELIEKEHYRQLNDALEMAFPDNPDTDRVFEETKNRREFWADFISELFMTSPMVEQLMSNKNIKRIKRNHSNTSGIAPQSYIEDLIKKETKLREESKYVATIKKPK